MRRRGIGLATVASARPPLRRRRDAGTGNPSPSPASVQTVRPAAPPEINDGPHRRSVVRGPTRIEPFRRRTHVGGPPLPRARPLARALSLGPPGPGPGRKEWLVVLQYTSSTVEGNPGYIFTVTWSSKRHIGRCAFDVRTYIL